MLTEVQAEVIAQGNVPGGCRYLRVERDDDNRWIAVYADGDPIPVNDSEADNDFIQPLFRRVMTAANA